MLLKSVSDSEVIEIIGHRGASGVAPENTKSAFLKAIEFGLKQVEFDVCLTKDGVPVVFHDELINRCSNGRGKLSNLTLKELESYDFGSWFHADFKGESILTLEELLKLLSDNNVYAQLELKLHKGVPASLLVDQTLQVISSMNVQCDQLTISSFNRAALNLVAASGKQYKIAALFDRPKHDWKQWINECHADYIHIDRSLVNGDFFKDIVNSGCGLRSYTVNDIKTARRLYALGVTGFFTDYPDRLDPRLIITK